MLINIRLCDADRERYGVVDELVLDMEALKDLEYDEYQALEAATLLPVAAFLPSLESGSLETAIVKRVAVFLALRLAGTDVSWDTCKPRPGRVLLEREDDPAGPPAGPSESSSEDAAALSS